MYIEKNLNLHMMSTCDELKSSAFLKDLYIELDSQFKN